jgi:hypothetical protein
MMREKDLRKEFCKLKEHNYDRINTVGIIIMGFIGASQGVMSTTYFYKVYTENTPADDLKVVSVMFYISNILQVIPPVTVFGLLLDCVIKIWKVSKNN